MSVLNYDPLVSTKRLIRSQKLGLQWSPMFYSHIATLIIESTQIFTDIDLSAILYPLKFELL